jgi:hypothetical protein
MNISILNIPPRPAEGPPFDAPVGGAAGVGLALLSLVILLGVSTSASGNTANMSKSLLDLSGFPLRMIEAFLVSVVSLGACFGNFHRINTSIFDGCLRSESSSARSIHFDPFLWLIER